MICDQVILLYLNFIPGYERDLGDITGQVTNLCCTLFAGFSVIQTYLGLFEEMRAGGRLVSC